MNQDFNDDDLNNAMEDYRWDSISWGTGWEHVKSRYLNGKRGNDIQVTHRLYLNVEPIDVYTVANELIKNVMNMKCHTILNLITMEIEMIL